MKRLLILLFSSLLLVACTTSTPTNSFQVVSPSDAIALMEQTKDYVLVDVRRSDEFESGHIPNAVNWPNEEIQAGNFGVFTDKNQTYFIYCRSGNRSNQAAQVLAKEGFTHIIDMGGIIDWPGEIVAED